MVDRRLLVLSLACQLVASAAAATVEFFLFPLTIDSWNYNHLGTGREVAFTRAGPAAVSWRVLFYNDVGSRSTFGERALAELRGEIAITSPDDCRAVKLMSRTDDPDDLPRQREGPVFDSLSAKEIARDIEPSSETDAAIARFAQPWSRYLAESEEREAKAMHDGSWCEGLRDRCEQGEGSTVEVLFRWSYPGALPYTWRETGAAAISGASCDRGEITPDELVARCHRARADLAEREQKARKTAEQHRHCTALVFAQRDGDAISLHILGGDGVEWSNATAEPPSPWKGTALFFAYLPLTIAGDAVLTALSPVAFVFGRSPH